MYDMYKFLTIILNFHPNYECSLYNSSINIYECQNNKEGSKILLTFTVFNIFSLHNLGSRLFLTNMK
jgi:hypothetical protein